jgi:hypothetical protein
MNYFKVKQNLEIFRDEPVRRSGGDQAARLFWPLGLALALLSLWTAGGMGF